MVYGQLQGRSRTNAAFYYRASELEQYGKTLL